MPPVVVEAPKKPAKKSAAKKKSAPTSAQAQVPQAVPPPVSPTAQVNTAESSASPLYADPGPGLNLDTPNATASRLGMTPMETPASVDVISGSTARERGQDSVTDAVTRNAAGYSSVALPVFGSGFATRGFQGNGSVMQLYDGTQLATGRGNVTFPFNMWSVERIEVLHGPASVLYGEGAIGGVINIVPKKAITSGFQNEAQVFVDSNLTRRVSLDSGGPVSDALAYRFNITGDASEGWVDRGESNNFATSGALRLQAAPNLVFTLTSDYGEQHPMEYWGTPLRDGVIDKSLRDKNYNVDNSMIRFRDSRNQFKTEWSPSQAVLIRNVAYYLTSNREWRDAENYFLDPATNIVERTEFTHLRQQQEQVGNRTDATIKSSLLGLKNETVVGFDVNRAKFRYGSYIPGYSDTADAYEFDPGTFPDPDRLDPGYRSVLRQYSAFGEDRLQLLDNLTVVGGLRYDAPSIERTDVSAAASYEKDFHAWGWRAGVVYNPIRDVALYAQYATGTDPINVPLLDLQKQFSDFKLTTGRQTEVGVKQSFWDGKGEWTLSAYEIVKNNVIVADFSFDSLFQQAGQQSSRGIEFAAGLELGGGWRIDGNAAWLKAKYDDYQYVDFSNPPSFSGDYSGNVPVLIPEKVGNIWLTWAFAPAWQASAGLQYVGASFENAANTLVRPAYTLVDAGLQWKPTQNSTIDFRVENVFDKVYAQYLKYDDPAQGGSGALQGYLGRPRTFEAAMSVKF